MKIYLRPDERFIREGAANMQRGLETVGGWLYLTDKRILFESHRFNMQTGPTEISLSDVMTARPAWTRFLGFLPIFPNSLVISAGEKEYSFVLSGREQWASTISAHASQPNA
jgi:hypothetical protein